MSIQQKQIVQPTYNGQDIYYRTPVDAIITDGMSLDDYIRNTTGVVESGSNSNGSYIKFADGTLIQQGNTGRFTVPASTSGSKDVTFPINFYDINYYVTQTSLGGDYYSWVAEATTNKTISGFKCNCWNNTSTSAADIEYSWIAIGRWKDYDASVLPNTQKSTIINSSSTNYSNNEQVIGLWTDGKPLYRKTYNFGSLPNSSTKSISSGLSGISVKNTYGTCHRSSDSFQPPINSVRPESASAGIGAYYDSGDMLKMLDASDRTTMTAEITIEYTKDSDQPVTSQTKDLLRVVNGKNITNLETLIQQRISDTLTKNFESIIDNRIDSKMNSKILWSNSKPTSSFAQQNITLDSKDYNYLTWYYYNWVGGDDSNGGMRIESVKIPKGYNVNMTVSICISSGVEHLGTRGATYVSDTVYTVKNQSGYLLSGSQSKDNAWVVPIMVVGSNY